MKITLGMIAMVLLVSSCGLLKKTTTTTQSDTREEVRNMEYDLNKENEIQVNTKTDVTSFAVFDGATVTQLEGQDILITNDGSVRMSKGKVNQQSREKTKVVQEVNQTKEVNRYDQEQLALATKQKLAVRKKDSSYVSKPQSSMLLWLGIGFIALIILCCWWIRKKNR